MLLHSELTERLMELVKQNDELSSALMKLIADTSRGIAPESLTGPTPKQKVDPYKIRRAVLPFAAKLPAEFLNSCLWIEDELGLDAHNLIVCMGFETGETFDPAAKNPGSSATGLIQFMDATAKRLGTTTAALAEMNQTGQLTYVYRYFREYKDRGHDLSKWDLGDTYMAILWPKGIGKPDDYVLWNKNEGQVYVVNRGLDGDKDGNITRGECLKRVREVEKRGLRARKEA